MNALTSPGDENGPSGHFGVSFRSEGIDLTPVLSALSLTQVRYENSQSRLVRVAGVNVTRGKIRVGQTRPSQHVQRRQDSAVRDCINLKRQQF